MTKNELPWSKIHEYLVAVGGVSDTRRFCIQIIEKLHTIIPYDQARIFIVNDNDHVVDAVVFGTNKKWNRIYLDYYHSDKSSKHTFTGREPADGLIGVHNWIADERDEFIANYIAPQGLQHSLGFGLVDGSNRIKSVFSLDRICAKQFTSHEQTIMQCIHPHINNLHRMLLFTPPSEQNYLYAQEDEVRLTPREVEIADHLSEGTTATNISKKLCLSPQTVYRHIANIHKKLHVTNRQELILKWIRIRSLQV